VLDEPMNGLDPLGMAELREQLRMRAVRDHVAIVVSSHLLHEVEQICQRVIFIREGRLISDTTLGGDTTGACAAVVLMTGDDVAAAALLGRHPFVKGVLAAGKGVECRLASKDVPTAVRALVSAGIPIHAVIPRTGSLEELYLSHFDDSRTRSIQ
jgi:ABC-2 type transport system ATP-binding protein